MKQIFLRSICIWQLPKLLYVKAQLMKYMFLDEIVKAVHILDS